MEKSVKNKLKQKVGLALHRHAGNIQTDQSVSVQSPNGQGKARTSNTHTPASMVYVIEELHKMSLIVPPNRTVVESDYIPFPPDWTGPIPACQQRMRNKQGKCNQQDGDKKLSNIFSKTMSFLKKKRSSSLSSESSQAPHKPKPLVTAAKPVQLSNQQNMLPENKAEGTTDVSLPSKRTTTPSTYNCSSSEGNNKTLGESKC